MQPVFLYTVEHTAGSFTGDLLTDPYDSVWLGDAHLVLRGRRKYLDFYKIKGFQNLWFQKYLFNYLSKDEEKKDLVLFSAHHSVPNSDLVCALQISKPPIPFVTSMRDPLLVIHTKLWRHCAEHGLRIEDLDIEFREELVKKYTSLLYDILCIPEDHAFLLPVDLLGIQCSRTRINWIKRLHLYCDLPIYRSQSYTKYEQIVDKAVSWNRIGDTQSSEAIIASGLRSDFISSRRAIYEKNSDLIKQTLDLEFEYLNKQDDMKDKLEILGYRHLGWW